MISLQKDSVLQIILLKIVIVLFFYIIKCVYYEDVLLSLWMAFTNNTKHYPVHIFLFLEAKLASICIFRILCLFIIYALTRLILTEYGCKKVINLDLKLEGINKSFEFITQYVNNINYNLKMHFY